MEADSDSFYGIWTKRGLFALRPELLDSFSWWIIGPIKLDILGTSYPIDIGDTSNVKIIEAPLLKDKMS